MRHYSDKKMNFSKRFFQNLSSEKMTLCNNTDKTWFSDTLTSARPLGGCYNSCLSGLGINTILGVQQIFMHRETCLKPILSFRAGTAEYLEKHGIPKRLNILEKQTGEHQEPNLLFLSV